MKKKLDKDKVLGEFNSFCGGTLMETLQMEYIDLGEDFLAMKMPVSSLVMQPLGILHGGATMALAETVGSTASLLITDLETSIVKGMEISGNHVKSAVLGDVLFATARLIHGGRTTHIWEVSVTNQDDKLISHCKVTNMVLPKK